MMYCVIPEKCTELSISQHFYWKNSCETVHGVCNKCKACQCQFWKQNKKQYGKLPPKEEETKPWDTLCVNLMENIDSPQNEEE